MQKVKSTSHHREFSTADQFTCAASSNDTNTWDCRTKSPATEGSGERRLRRQGDSEEERSSDEEARSTDSEEELDSPARIFQSHTASPAQSTEQEAAKEATEKMDTSESG